MLKNYNLDQKYEAARDLVHFGCWSTILERLNAFFFKYYRVAFSYSYFCVRICFGIEMYELGWKGPLEIIHMIPAWRNQWGTTELYTAKL